MISTDRLDQEAIHAGAAAAARDNYEAGLNETTLERCYRAISHMRFLCGAYLDIFNAGGRLWDWKTTGAEPFKMKFDGFLD